MGRGKSQLKGEDLMVLNACRWRWWSDYMKIVGNPNMSAGHIGNIRLDKHTVHNTLYQAYKTGIEPCPLNEDQVYYRLTKLMDRGLLKKGYYGTFMLTTQGDPGIAQAIEDVERESLDQAERDRLLIERMTRTMDELIPGHNLNVGTGYGHRVMGYPNVTLQGPGHQVRMLLTWAEMYVRAQDEAAEEEE